MVVDEDCGQLLTLDFSLATYITASIFGGFGALYLLIGLCPIMLVVVSKKEDQPKSFVLGCCCWLCSTCCTVPIAIMALLIMTVRHWMHTLRFMSWSWIFGLDFSVVFALRSFNIDMVMSANSLQVFSFILFLMDIVNGFWVNLVVKKLAGRAQKKAENVTLSQTE
jgi:hypothetical protein